MRLDRLKIGSTKDSPTHQFKNLKNVTIDFDQDHWVTVVIGWNGTGKSNVLEALAIIFRDLIQRKKTPAFSFVLQYRMGSGEDTLHIEIDADPDRTKEPFTIHIASEAEARGVGTLTPFIEEEPEISARRGKQITLNAFLKDDDKHLPRYVFSYYSGESPRMHEVFRPYLESYDSDLRSGKDPGLKRLFYALPVHSQFVLLAFLIQQSEGVRTFLLDHLGIDPDEGIESVLFVLRQPPWKSKAPDGDPRFWNARGVVSEFLYRLYDIAIAPLDINRRVSVSLWNKETLQFKYLYIKDVQALRRLVGSQSPAQFFRDLESTHVSQLIEEARIRIRLKKNDGSVTFRELSEGEQQLLTVLGLLRFTAESESLFLLDEPDTHLNPRWCVDYLHYLQMFAGRHQDDQKNSHIVLTTHNPLAIAELVKEQVQILYREPKSRNIRAEYPEFDPRGMGFANIVTSDMFGLDSSLDSATNNDLVRLHRLSTKEKLTSEERRTLAELRERLEKLDFNFAVRDRLEQEFLRSRFDLAENNAFDGPIVSSDNKQKSLEALIRGLIRSLSENNT
ncbi:AAA family ATPase [Sinorhizobium medicae]|nr:AAA family ATPase [Sinorhizobium medicae]